MTLTFKKFVAAFQYLEEFYQLDYSEMKLKVLHHRLQNYSDKSLKQAILVLIERGLSYDERLNVLPLLLSELGGALKESDAEDLTQKIITLRDKIGRYESPPKTALTQTEAAVVHQLGGWVRVCNMPDNNLSWSVKNLLKGGFIATNSEYPVLLGLSGENKRSLRSAENLGEVLGSGIKKITEHNQGDE